MYKDECFFFFGSMSINWWSNICSSWLTSYSLLRAIHSECVVSIFYVCLWCTHNVQVHFYREMKSPIFRCPYQSFQSLFLQNSFILHWQTKGELSMRLKTFQPFITIWRLSLYFRGGSFDSLLFFTPGH